MTELVLIHNSPVTSPVSSALALLTLPREQALAQAARLPPRELAYGLSKLQKPTDLAEFIARVPAEHMRLVLMQDGRVFKDATPFVSEDEPFDEAQGTVWPISGPEGLALKKAGHGRWLVPMEYNDMGYVTVWGMRSTLTRFYATEALERITDILEADNDVVWKYATLASLPPAYIALAIREAFKLERHDVSLFESMRNIVDANPESDENFIRDIEYLLLLPEEELFTHLHEDRDATLVRATPELHLTETAQVAMEEMKQGASAKTLLEQIRTGVVKNPEVIDG